MTISRPLPPHCTLRPAAAHDRAAIQSLLTQFRREVLPPPSWADRVWRGLAIAVLLGLGVQLTGMLGLNAMMNVLVAPAIAIGLGFLAALILTWNDDWKNFWIIEHHHQLIACAKLRQTSDYSLLHDVYVTPAWRKQGLGSYLVTAVGHYAQKPLYLTCFPPLLQFYLQLGFTPVTIKALSPLIRYELGIPNHPEVIPLVLKS